MRLADERDPEVLRKAALLLESENKRLTDRLVAVTQKLLTLEGKDGRALQLELEELKRQLAQRNQQLFGRSTERRPDAAPDSVTAEKDAAPQRGHGRREQTNLRTVELPIFTLDEPDKQCPKCGGALAEMKGQFEESEEITLVTREWVVQKIRRQKYRCGCGACVETALGPLKLFPGARYSIDFAVEVAIAKYCDHLPLERQARIMGREGLVVDSQVLWDYLHALAGVLAPAHERLHAHVLASTESDQAQSLISCLYAGNEGDRMFVRRRIVRRRSQPTVRGGAADEIEWIAAVRGPGCTLGHCVSATATA